MNEFDLYTRCLAAVRERSDTRLTVEMLEAKLTIAKNGLVDADASTIFQKQGAARQLKELIADLTAPAIPERKPSSY